MASEARQASDRLCNAVVGQFADVFGRNRFDDGVGVFLDRNRVFEVHLVGRRRHQFPLIFQTQFADNCPSLRRIRAAGFVIIGKTNTPEFGSIGMTESELNGDCRNPWDVSRTPGGSSGGSAAAIAAGLSGLELGSDIGGSIRIPSGWCGIFGHKPSWGIVPSRGHIPGWPGALREDDINVVGPMARSADDLALALGVLAGPLPDRARAWRLELPPPRHTSLRGFRVAAWLDDPAFPVDTAVRERLEAAVGALRKAGVAVDDEARPDFSLEQAFALYRLLMVPITSLVMRDADVAAINAQAARLAPDAKDDMSRFLREIGLRHREWILAHEERERERASWADFFQRFDVLLCPVAPVPAVRHDHREPMLLRTVEINGGARPYTDLLVWPGVIGVAHLPASVAPVGRTRDGLPVGIQIVAPYLEDRTALAFAASLEALLGGFEAPAGLSKLG